MLDHFIAEYATARKVNSYYTLAISRTFRVEKHTILGPARDNVLRRLERGGMFDGQFIALCC